ncbi:META domain-containing protein [Streptomyces achromogenes]|uniref:META domain-containing protein n=1 Tax=Streptomyces achromogenes TaxID=67255 RepID=UPI002283A0BC|nr:META domain-containing protein [Streptomyces sp. UMAF16]
MKRHKQWLGVAVIPLVVACAAGKADSGAMDASEPVTGVEWRVERVTVGGESLAAPAAGSPHLRIGTDGTAAGNLGCNRFSAPVSVHGDRIAFGALRTTKMACDPARMSFERALAKALDGQTLTGAAERGGLTLTTGHGDRVHLTRGAPE